MAKLNKKVAKKVEKAAVPGAGFEPLEPGKYIGTLAKVESRTSQAGNPVWNVEFEDIHSLDGEKQPGRLWYNLNMPIEEMPDTYREGEPDSTREKKWESYQSMTEGRIKGFFEAFGYTVDSDTDEMIGERCVLQVGTQTIQRGKRAGQIGNSVENLEPLTDDLAESLGDEDDGEEF